jgi:hypothetical protein
MDTEAIPGAFLPSFESLALDSLGLSLQFVVFAGELLVGPFLHFGLVTHLAPLLRFHVQHVCVIPPLKYHERGIEDIFGEHTG